MFKNNPHITAASASRFRPHPAIALLLFLLMLVVSEILAWPFIEVFNTFTDNWRHPLLITLKYSTTELIFPFLSITLIVAFWVKQIEKRPISSLGFPKTEQFRTYFKGFGLGLGLMTLYFIFALLFNVYSIETIAFKGNHLFIWTSILIILPGWMVQSASEEILTRGWLFQVTSKKRVLTGIVISSTIFSLLHIANNGITALSVGNLTLYGLFAIFYTLQTENLWAVCGFHCSWNWAQGNIFGISVSGNPIIGGSLLEPGKAMGSDILTGGAFGAEGSIIVSIILCLSILAVLRRPIYNHFLRLK